MSCLHHQGRYVSSRPTARLIHLFFARACSVINIDRCSLQLLLSTASTSSLSYCSQEKSLGKRAKPGNHLTKWHSFCSHPNKKSLHLRLSRRTQFYICSFLTLSLLWCKTTFRWKISWIIVTHIWKRTSWYQSVLLGIILNQLHPRSCINIRATKNT